MMRSVNSLIDAVNAPHPLNFRSITEDDASIRNTTSTSRCRQVLVVVVVVVVDLVVVVVVVVVVLV